MSQTTFIATLNAQFCGEGKEVTSFVKILEQHGRI
jgi:hypothetical protein